MINGATGMLCAASGEPFAELMLEEQLFLGVGGWVGGWGVKFGG